MRKVKNLDYDSDDLYDYSDSSDEYDDIYPKKTLNDKKIGSKADNTGNKSTPMDYAVSSKPTLKSTAKVSLIIFKPHLLKRLDKAADKTKESIGQFSKLLDDEHERLRSQNLSRTNSKIENSIITIPPPSNNNDTTIGDNSSFSNDDEDLSDIYETDIDWTSYKAPHKVDPTTLSIRQRSLVKFLEFAFNIPLPTANYILDFADYNLGNALLFVYSRLTGNSNLLNNVNLTDSNPYLLNLKFITDNIDKLNGFTLIKENIRFSEILRIYGENDFSSRDLEYDLLFSEEYNVCHLKFEEIDDDIKYVSDIFILLSVSKTSHCPIIPFVKPSNKYKYDSFISIPDKYSHFLKGTTLYSIYSLKSSALLALNSLILNFKHKEESIVTQIDSSFFKEISAVLKIDVKRPPLYINRITNLWKNNWIPTDKKGLYLYENGRAEDSDENLDYTVEEIVEEELVFGQNGGHPTKDQLSPGTVVNISLVSDNSIRINSSIRGIFKSIISSGDDGVIAKLTNGKIGKVTSIVIKKINHKRVATFKKDKQITQQILEGSNYAGSYLSDPKLERRSKRMKTRFKKVCKTPEYAEMLKIRSTLPAWSVRNEIISTVENNQVIVIEGDTGCGKSTQVPQFILDHHIMTNRGAECKILVTQPRRISAMGVAQRVAQERAENEENTSELIGYQIRFNSDVTYRTRVIFATTGIVLRKLQNTNVMNSSKKDSFADITHIIVDEVHERNLETDFLLLILRNMLRENKKLKIILMSATMNATLFQDYFSKLTGQHVPKLFIPGRTFPVKVVFMEDAITETGYRPNDVEYARKYNNKGSNINALRKVDGKEPNDVHLDPEELMKRYPNVPRDTILALSNMNTETIQYPLITKIVQMEIRNLLNDFKKPKGKKKKEKRNEENEGNDSTQVSDSRGILIFLPGVAEIDKCISLLKDDDYIYEKTGEGDFILPLHGNLLPEEQMMVFDKAERDLVKIIVSTNIAETSITINDIVCVIDSCKMKSNRFDAINEMSILEECFVSKANGIQRRGRAGRVRPGICYHLVTGFTFNKLLEPTILPEILRSSLTQVLLKVKTTPSLSGRLSYVLSKMIDPPPNDGIILAKHSLVSLQAMYSDESLTPLGVHLSILPVDTKIGKMLIYGAMFHCLGDILTISAALNVQSPFYSPLNERKAASEALDSFATENSDHLTVLTAYNEWQSIRRKGGYKEEKEFCKSSYLSRTRLDIISKTKLQLVEHLAEIGFFEVSGVEDVLEEKKKKKMQEKIEKDKLERNAEDSSSDESVVNESRSKDPAVQKDLTTRVAYSKRNIRSQINAVKKLKDGRMDGLNEIVPAKYRERDGNVEIIKAVLCAALFPNVAVYESEKSGSKGKKNLNNLNGEMVVIHPASVNARSYNLSNKSRYLIYHEIIKTSRTFIRDSCPVRPAVLMLFAEEFIWNKNKKLFGPQKYSALRFNCGSLTAEIFQKVRSTMNDLLTAKLIEPTLDISNEPIISAIVEFLKVDA